MTDRHLYFLHVNGELIYGGINNSHQIFDMRDGDFVRHFWVIDTQNRAEAWSMLVEAACLGAETDRIEGLAALWSCDDVDALHFAEHIGIRLYRDGNAWCATKSDFEDLQTSPAGLSDQSALMAMAELCSKLGFNHQKIWGTNFADLVKP